MIRYGIFDSDNRAREIMEVAAGLIVAPPFWATIRKVEPADPLMVSAAQVTRRQ